VVGVGGPTGKSDRAEQAEKHAFHRASSGCTD